MNELKRLRRENNDIVNELRQNSDDLRKISEETARAAELAKNVGIIVKNIDRQFEEATKLKRRDIHFLFLAIALQCIRQYILTPFPERMDDQTSAKNTKGHGKERSNRFHSEYNPTLLEIQTNPVPFDANRGANGALSGGGKMGHRVTAIGHDPLLGLVFGTSNIATSTLTNHLLQSYHIGTIDKVDHFMKPADTAMVLSRTKEKLLFEGLEGTEIVCYSLYKELVHLKSDIGTHHSLPLPIVSVYDAKLASDLAMRGLDMANMVNIGKQATYASMINTLIAMLHGLQYDPEISGDRSLYDVRTRKILSYSNVIATSSNVLATAFMAAAGSIDMAKKYFDIGGMLVTFYRIVNDKKFIQEIKMEFIEQEFYNLVLGK